MIMTTEIPNINIHELRYSTVLLLTTLPQIMGIVGFRSRMFSEYDAKV